VVLENSILTSTARDTGFHPLFSPLRLQEVQALKLAWKQAAVQNPLVFHAEVVASVGYVLLTTSNSTPEDTRALADLLSHHNGLALQKIRSDIENPIFQPTDGHIHCICMLACQSDLALTEKEPFPLSPMGAFQHNYTFSHFQTTLAHVTAFYKFVEMRGGIQNIKTHALAQVLEM
jgi:hypothetical protein